MTARQKHREVVDLEYLFRGSLTVSIRPEVKRGLDDSDEPYGPLVRASSGLED